VIRPAAALLTATLCLTLAACGGGSTAGWSAAIECAPFARALTGVALSGDAADWWRQAAGRYARSSRPATGSLLVFRRSARLPEGHVAVVSRVLDARDIMVTQANWVHHRVTSDQPVVDVSRNGDWSAVRVWWPPIGRMGTSTYATYGFVRPDRTRDHDSLIAAMPAAIRAAKADP
jgi:hypothetical protein